MFYLRNRFLTAVFGPAAHPSAMIKKPAVRRPAVAARDRERLQQSVPESVMRETVLAAYEEVWSLQDRFQDAVTARASDLHDQGQDELGSDLEKILSELVQQQIVDIANFDALFQSIVVALAQTGDDLFMLHDPRAAHQECRTIIARLDPNR